MRTPNPLSRYRAYLKPALVGYLILAVGLLIALAIVRGDADDSNRAAARAERAATRIEARQETTRRSQVAGCQRTNRRTTRNNRQERAVWLSLYAGASEIPRSSPRRRQIEEAALDWRAAPLTDCLRAYDGDPATDSLIERDDPANPPIARRR